MYITDDNAERAISMLNMEMEKILAIGELSKDTLCALGEIVDVLKDIKEIDEEEAMGNSFNSYNSYNRSSYGSYAGGGGGGNSNAYGGYSQRRSSRRGRSYDSERDNIMSKMEQFMNQASNENERQLVRRIMESI